MDEPQQAGEMRVAQARLLQMRHHVLQVFGIGPADPDAAQDRLGGHIVGEVAGELRMAAVDAVEQRVGRRPSGSATLRQRWT